MKFILCILIIINYLVFVKFYLGNLILRWGYLGLGRVIERDLDVKVIGVMEIELE